MGWEYVLVLSAMIQWWSLSTLGFDFLFALSTAARERTVESYDWFETLTLKLNWARLKHWKQVGRHGKPMCIQEGFFFGKVYGFGTKGQEKATHSKLSRCTGICPSKATEKSLYDNCVQPLKKERTQRSFTTAIRDRAMEWETNVNCKVKQARPTWNKARETNPEDKVQQKRWERQRTQKELVRKHMASTVHWVAAFQQAGLPRSSVSSGTPGSTAWEMTWRAGAWMATWKRLGVGTVSCLDLLSQLTWKGMCSNPCKMIWRLFWSCETWNDSEQVSKPVLEIICASGARQKIWHGGEVRKPSLSPQPFKRASFWMCTRVDGMTSLMKSRKAACFEWNRWGHP